jgi:SPFH domain / Band 7 family
MKRIIMALVALALLTTGCATTSAPADLKGVHYSGGSFSSKKFSNCIDPSTRDFSPGDKYYYYPTRQISFEASDDSSAERGRFLVVSSDSAQLLVPVRLTFQLDTNCDVLRKFHEEIGSRYNAAIQDDVTDDGETTSADYPKGWVALLNDVIGKPLDNSLIRIAQKYPWRQVWSDDAVRQEMQIEIGSTIEDAVASQAGGDYFSDFTVLVQQPTPEDPALVDAIAQEQAGIAQAKADKAKAEADADTARAKAKADEIAAEAQEKLAAANAKTQEATIRGFGGIDNYLRWLCITNASCGNPYRDQFLYGGTPQGGGQ